MANIISFVFESKPLGFENDSTLTLTLDDFFSIIFCKNRTKSTYQVKL